PSAATTRRRTRPSVTLSHWMGTGRDQSVGRIAASRARCELAWRTTHDSGSQNVIRRVITEEIEVFSAPIDHFLDALFQADLRFPPDVLPDGGAVEPILAVLTQPITSGFAQRFK